MLVRSYRTFSPLPVIDERPIGGLFSVALSVASRRLFVFQHSALWSPDLPRIKNLIRGHSANSPHYQSRPKIDRRDREVSFRLKLFSCYLTSERRAIANFPPMTPPKLAREIVNKIVKNSESQETSAASLASLIS